MAFTAAARKPPLDPGPAGDGPRLEPGFRERILTALDELALAWAEPGAAGGATAAGGVELPAEVALLVALDEVTVRA